MMSHPSLVTHEGEFKDELTRLINRFSLENGSDTPDYVLAIFLNDCREAFDRVVKLNEGRSRLLTMHFEAQIRIALDRAVAERLKHKAAA